MTIENQKVAEHVMGKMLNAISDLNFPNAHQKKLVVFIPGVLIDLIAEYWKILNPKNRAFKLIDDKIYFNAIELRDGYELAIVACMMTGMTPWTNAGIIRANLDVSEKQMFSILKERYQIGSLKDKSI